MTAQNQALNNNNKNNITNYNPININNNINNDKNYDININKSNNTNQMNNNINNIINNNSISNRPENLSNYRNIQSEFTNPIQLQNQRGFSMNSKDSKDVNIFLPNQINPNFNIINNPNNNFFDPYNQQQNNLYMNAPQMYPMPYNFQNAYGYGFHPNMPMGFPINQYPYSLNSFSHGFIMPAVSNPNSQVATSLSGYPKEKLLVSSIAKIEIIPGNSISNSNAVAHNPKIIKKQNTERSLDNSRVIKVKSEEIVAIDKKDTSNNYIINAKRSENNNSNKMNVTNSNFSIKTDENAFENSVNKSLKNEKFKYEQIEKEVKKNNYDNDSYGQNSSRFAEDISIQDEIESKKSENKKTQNSLKGKINFKESKTDSNNHDKINSNNNINFIKKNISIKKTESDIQEDNSQINLDKFNSKKSLIEQQKAHHNNEQFTNNQNNQSKSEKIQNTIDEEIQSEKDAKNTSKRIPTEKSNARYEESFKKTLHNNSNISENLSYKASKKAEGRKDIITNFDDFNNKENSIDDIIDSKSLKEIENEIHSDFKNDQPVIEESKKSIEVKDLSPKNLVSHPSRLITEMKYEKLEVINEESIIDKSKSHIREGHLNNNNDIHHNNNENFNSSGLKHQMQNSDLEEDYEKYNNFEQDSKKQSRNDIVRIPKEVDDKDNNSKSIDLKDVENKENPNETFDSLKSHSVKFHKDQTEENHVDIDKRNYYKIAFPNTEGKLADNIIHKTEESYHSEHHSEKSSISKKNKAAKLESQLLFEELKANALTVVYESKPVKTDESLKEVVNEKKDEEAYEDDNENDKINKCQEKTLQAKPLENSQNLIIEEEHGVNNNDNHRDFLEENENKHSDNNIIHTEEIKEEKSLNKNEAVKKQENDIKEENQYMKKTEENNNNDINKQDDIYPFDKNDDIQEEENLVKNQEASLSNSINEKKVKTEAFAIQKDKEEDEINNKNTNTIKKTDPDAIEEENHLGQAGNEEINKSFKSKKSVLALETQQQHQGEIAIPTEVAYKGEQEIIQKEVKQKTNEDSVAAEILISEPKKAECEIELNYKEIEIKETFKIEEGKKKESFSSFKNNIKISFIGEQQDLTEFDYVYKVYKEKLNQALKITFQPKDSIADYFSFFNPKIIKISNEANDLIGLCCISFDNTWDDLVKININHISILDLESFENLVKLVLDFIKEHFPVDEILIYLHYELKDNNFEINADIRDLFKNTFKFKWNKLENANGERIQKIALALESAANEKKSLISKLMSSTLEVNHFSVLHLTNKNQEEDNDNNNHNNNNFNPTNENHFANNNSSLSNLNYFSLVSSLCQIHGHKNKVKSEMLEKIEKDKFKVRNYM